MFDPPSFIRVIAFAVVFAGIEFRYVNRREEGWTKEAGGSFEKPAFWVITPYHAFLLLPLFVIVSFSFSLTAWAGNTFLLAVAEDMAYFGWRGSRVKKEDWTTTLFGSFSLGGYVVPSWWPLDLFVAAALFWLPLL